MRQGVAGRISVGHLGKGMPQCLGRPIIDPGQRGLNAVADVVLASGPEVCSSELAQYTSSG